MSETTETASSDAAPQQAVETRRESSSVAGWAMAAAIFAAGVGVAALALPYGPNPEKLLRLEAQQAKIGHAALSLSAGQLRAAVLSGSAFGNELALVRLLGGGDAGVSAAVAVLGPLQSEGVITSRRALTDFEQIAAGALIAESTAPDSSWFGQTIGRLSAVTVALMMEAQVNPLNSEIGPIIKSMQTAIVAGDLRAAVGLAGTLPEQARTAFAPWAEAVGKRLAAVAAAEDIFARSTSAVAKAADR